MAARLKFRRSIGDVDVDADADVEADAEANVEADADAFSPAKTKKKSPLIQLAGHFQWLLLLLPLLGFNGSQRTV